MTPMSGQGKRIRLGVVGAGNIAVLNVAGYLEHDRCDVVAVCDTDKDLAQAAATTWGAAKVFTDTVTRNSPRPAYPRHRSAASQGTF